MPSCIEEIKILRQAIRYHRDQKGDDRCWLDDNRLWMLLPDTQQKPIELPPFDEMMKKCRAFYMHRRADTPDVMPPEAILDSADWDKDLENMNNAELEQELQRTQLAVRMHRDVRESERTRDHDRALYRSLPEKLPADFRLPSEDAFLGEARAPIAGCPSFWRSHQTCSTKEHDLGRWGPCT